MEIGVTEIVIILAVVVLVFAFWKFRVKKDGK